MSDGVSEGNEVERRTIEIAPGQADMLVGLQRAAQQAQNQISVAAQAVLAGFDDLPDEYGLEQVSDDPPQLTIRYRADTTEDEDE